MNVLVDSSVWSLALRRRGEAPHGAVRQLTELVREGRARIVGPIRQEVLTGIRETAQFERLRVRLSAFPDLSLSTSEYERAAEHADVCRRHGIQGSHTDFLLCATAERYGLVILTTDEDFRRYAEHVPVLLHPWAESSLG